MKVRLAALTGILALCAGCTTVRQLRDPSELTPDGKAQKTRTDDALDYSVAKRIAAPPAVVWGVLTDGPAYTDWNSTIVSLDGEIALGEELELVAKIAPDRTFEITVSTFEAPTRLVWEDGGSMFLGVRTFTLREDDAGGTIFSMQETYSGGMLGMIEDDLPDFTEAFETFTRDLETRSTKLAGSTSTSTTSAG